MAMISKMCRMALFEEAWKAKAKESAGADGQRELVRVAEDAAVADAPADGEGVEEARLLAEKIGLVSRPPPCLHWRALSHSTPLGVPREASPRPAVLVGLEHDALALLERLVHPERGEAPGR